MKAQLIATGHYVPERVVSNADLKQFPVSAAALIEAKTGIRERRHAAPDQTTSDLAIKAAQRCLDRVGFDARSLDAIILATSSPDRIQPATATRVQHQIGAANAFAFDLNSVCSGAVFGVSVADALIRAGTCVSVLVVGAELYSRFLNPADFSTYPYFGDGAGAALFQRAEDDEPGVIASRLRTDGAGADLIQVPAGGTRLRTPDGSNQRDLYFQMDGRAVYQFATGRVPELIDQSLAAAAIDKSEVRFVITHQANKNIIAEIAARTDIPLEKFVVNVDKYGNTAAASILIALDELMRSGCVNSGDIVLTAGFGGGLSWGTNIIQLAGQRSANG